MVANRGNSPGIFYAFDPRGKKYIKPVNYSLKPADHLPMVIDTGDGYPEKLELWMTRDDLGYAKDNAILKIDYTVLASLGRKID